MNNEQRMVCTVGIPACGKSTWAEQFIKDNPEFVRTERDMIRAKYHTDTGNLWDYKFSKYKEDAVTFRQTEHIRLDLTIGRSVVVSDTNLNERTRNYLQSLAEEFGIKVEYQVFDVPFHQALKWNAKRPNHVPESVMIHMERKMRQYMGKFVQTPESRLKAEKTHPFSCVIMDIDATLADMKGIRGPFEWDRVGEDKVIEHVAEYARFIYTEVNHDLVLFSGRDSCSRNQTEEWLRDNDIPYDALYMRPEGSNVNDSIIKEDLYMKYIHGHYFVDHIVDDRKQVVMNWKAMGFNVMDMGSYLNDF